MSGSINVFAIFVGVGRGNDPHGKQCAEDTLAEMAFLYSKTLHYEEEERRRA